MITGGDLPDRRAVDRHQKKSAERQRENLRSRGFTGEFSDIGHTVVWELLRRNYSRSEAAYAGQLASTGGAYNYQGNHRIAGHLRVSERTVQRARFRLEADGWIRSHILETGQCVPGQRPVRHVQVVRALHNLLSLARARAKPREERATDRVGRGARKPQRVPLAAGVQHAAPADTNVRATPEDFDDLARRNPEFARYFVGLGAEALAAGLKAAETAKRADAGWLPEYDRSDGDRPLGSGDVVAGASDRRGRSPPPTN